MSDLIAPHGGLSEPVCCTVPEGEREAFLAEAESLTKVPVSAADLSTVYRIGDGTLAGQLATSEGDAARAAGLGTGAPCPVSYSDPSPFTAVGSSSRTYCDVKKELVRVFLAQ